MHSSRGLSKTDWEGGGGGGGKVSADPALEVAGNLPGARPERHRIGQMPTQFQPQVGRQPREQQCPEHGRGKLDKMKLARDSSCVYFVIILSWGLTEAGKCCKVLYHGCFSTFAVVFLKF